MAHNNTILLVAALENEKLQESRSNFMDWYHRLEVVFKSNKKDYVLEATLGDDPENTTVEAVEEFQKRSSDYAMVQSTILAAMEPGLQKQFEDWGPYETIVEL